MIKGKENYLNHIGLLKLLFDYDKIAFIAFPLATANHRASLGISNMQTSQYAGERRQKAYINSWNYKFSYTRREKKKKIIYHICNSLQKNQSLTYLSVLSDSSPLSNIYLCFGT